MTERKLNEIDRFFANEPIVVGFKRLNDNAVLPTKAHAQDSGWDLVASEDVIVEPGDTVVVKTGIAVQLPEGFEATVRGRSGVSSKTPIRVALGTIDNGYTSEIGIIVDNLSRDNWSNMPRFLDNSYDQMAIDRYPSGSYHIRKGDKLAQLVITRLPEITAVEITELGDTERGTKGYGSTGVSV